MQNKATTRYQVLTIVDMKIMLFGYDAALYSNRRTDVIPPP
jgi:hypothetical protein